MKEKSKIKTAFAFVKNIKTTGAISETSPAVEKEIVSNLPQERNKTVVEFGLGHGNITKEILKNLSVGSKLYSFEVNTKFCDYVSEIILDDRLTIVNKSAAELNQVLPSQVDGIVSSIPLTLFSKEKVVDILTKAKETMCENSYFSQILYSKNLQSTFKEIFDEHYITEVKNLPKAYIHHCKKK